MKVSDGFSRARDPQAPPGTPAARKSEKVMVLIVDDEPGILVALEYQLQRSYEVVTCDRPEEALEKLREVDVAAVISDQRMPGMTGSALLSEAARLRPDAARILLTGYADLSAVVEAVNSGQIYYYLTKPWRPAELEAVLGRGIERWRLVREREHLLERLRQSNADLQGFAYAMAHDLKQPLRAINGFAALLAEELSGSATDEAARLLGRIRSGSSRMAVLTDGLLRMARVAGQRPRLEIVDLADLAREVVDRLRAADPGRAVEVVVPASLPAWADRELISLALGALLENAWKFTGPVAGGADRAGGGAGRGRGDVRREGQRRRLRRGLRPQAVRAVPAPAPGIRVPRRGDRPRARLGRDPEPRGARAGLGRARQGGGISLFASRRAAGIGRGSKRAGLRARGAATFANLAAGDRGKGRLGSGFRTILTFRQSKRRCSREERHQTRPACRAAWRFVPAEGGRRSRCRPRGPHRAVRAPPRRRRMNVSSQHARRSGTVPASRAVKRVASVGVVLLLAVVGAVIAVVLVRREASIRREWRDRLVGTAEERKAAILDYLQERTQDAEVFAAFPSIREMAGAGERGGRAEGDAHIQKVFEAGRMRWGSRTLAFLGPDFSERLRAGNALEPEASDLLRRSAPKGSWSGLYTTRDGSMVAFAAPVAALPQEAPGGWIVLVDDAETNLWKHLRREPVATRTGEVLLARRSGDRLVFLSPLRHRRSGEAPLVLPLATAKVAASDAVEGRDGDGAYVDYRGKRVLAAVRHLRGPGWGLVVKVDVDEALAGVVRERVWAGATFLFVVLGLVALVRATLGRERLRASEEQRLQSEASEASLAQSEERYRKLFEENPAPMWIFDVETLRFLDANEATVQLYGYSREELLALTLRDLRPAEDVPAMEADVRVARTGIRKSGPSRHLRKDGGKRFVEIVTYDVDFEGRAARLVLASDLTERLAAEEEVRRLNAELEERVESRTEELLAKSKELEAFAYSISHDLRAPLRAIDGFSRMIEEEQASRLDEEGRRLLGVVRFNARRMGQLIDDLLAFSRAGRQDLRRSSVDTGELVRSVLAEVLPEAEREHSDVRIGDLPPAQADPALLRQVFVNLLSNAVKFTSTRTQRRLEISGRRETGRVIYEVSDNGVGFDMRYAGKLFGVFQRLHGREFEGTGVGLALVERIVARHAGSVAACGEVDQGATFTISLPDAGVCS